MNSKVDLNEKFISFLEQTKGQERKSVTHLNDRVLIVDGLNTFILSFSVDNTPETCYCSDGKVSWTAYCGPNWTCEKCCEKTKPKKKDE